METWTLWFDDFEFPLLGEVLGSPVKLWLYIGFTLLWKVPKPFKVQVVPFHFANVCSPTDFWIHTHHAGIPMQEQVKTPSFLDTGLRACIQLNQHM